MYIAISQHPLLSDSGIGIGLTFLGTASFALGAVYYRRIGDAYPPLELNGWQNLFGAFLLPPFAADFDIMMKSLSDSVFAVALAHLAITVSIGTMLLWFYMIRLIGASQASVSIFSFLSSESSNRQPFSVIGSRHQMC